MLTMFAQYGNSGGSGGGGGLSYGPVFWVILAAVVLVLLVLGTWALVAWTRRSPRRSAPAETQTHDRMDRAA
jgi:uncharacterized membrane protein